MKNKKFLTIKQVDKTIYSKNLLSEYQKLANYNWENDNHRFEVLNDNSQQYHISIDEVIFYLQKLKQQGANFVEINYHTDHQEYEFTGYLLQKSSKEEIEKYSLQEEKYFEALKRVEELENQIKSLKEEYNKNNIL